MLYVGIFFTLIGLGLLAAENLVRKVHNGRNPNVDITAETKDLIMKDAYIIPEVPVVIVSPASEEGKRQCGNRQPCRNYSKADRQIGL